MKIICNGEERFVSDNTKISEFIRELGFDIDSIVVEYNGKIISKDDYDHQLLEPGSILELIRFVGGG
jgi:sulfur carrier protein